MNKREPPTQEAFDKLLSWLDPDRDLAAEKYRRIYLRLVRIFAAKGCVDEGNLADQTVNVVALKIDWLIENYVGDPALYFYGVANKIFLEQRPRKPPPVPPQPPDNTQIERRCHCLERCLETDASPEERRLVIRYHEGEGRDRIENRKGMAEELGITVNALRIRICHIQARLRPCIEECLRQLDW
jgi:hypothetical protein